MDSCDLCNSKSYVYNNQCAGCRERLVMTAYPDRPQAERLIEYLAQATKLEKKHLKGEVKEWINFVHSAKPSGKLPTALKSYAEQKRRAGNANGAATKY